MIPVSEMLASRIRDGLRVAAAEAGWTLPRDGAVVEVEKPQNPAHGDYASNVAMRLARPLPAEPLLRKQRPFPWSKEL